jgi:hypothetical protein
VYASEIVALRRKRYLPALTEFDPDNTWSPVGE